MRVRRQLLFAVAFFFGLLTLIGLLGDFSFIADTVLDWTGFLVAVALILGVFNLFAVHSRRFFRGRKLNSAFLILSMLTVFGLAITDSEVVNVTNGGVDAVFNSVQAPLEAALASLLAFFLLFAGFQLVRRQPSWWTGLFVLTAVVILAGNALLFSSLLPNNVVSLIEKLRTAIDTIIVGAGMSGILIGVALGTITISLRLIIGLDRPYDR